jgi:hypothetical protein
MCDTRRTHVTRGEGSVYGLVLQLDWLLDFWLNSGQLETFCYAYELEYNYDALTN